MATEKRLIDANAFLDEALKRYTERERGKDLLYTACEVKQNLADMICETPTVDAVELPCKIGDWVWAIRSYHGKKHPKRGIVSDMYFSQDMRLQIVVKHIARGEWGKTVFATDKEAYAAIGERKVNGTA